MFEKTVLTLKLVAYVTGFFASFITRSLRSSLKRLGHRFLSQRHVPESERENIVIIGASFAGYYVAKYLTAALPPGGSFRVIVIEPHSHFNFTWVLPRFCVVEGHENKAMIPYSPFIAATPESVLRWIRDRVVDVSRQSVRLQSGEEIPYQYLVVATGSVPNNDGLPSRLSSDAKGLAIAEMKEIQTDLKTANKVVVVGGGAAGVELATDAKFQYPDKSVTLVHSRDAVMHRFGVELQTEALRGLRELGVDVILGERLISENKNEGFVTLKSGKVLPCDLLVNCTGQKPLSGIVSDLCPKAITSSGHIRVKPTMQIDDDRLPNIYACGDVADAQVENTNPNSRSAFCQALVVVDNLVLATHGKIPSKFYKPHWADSAIKLTLGLNHTVVNISDHETSLLWNIKKQDIALDSRGAWRHLGVKPYEDVDWLDSD